MNLTELKLIKKTAYLYEGLTPTHKTSMMLWESAGRAITEAQLTPQQISNLFQQVEQSATAAGDNRTLVGQGKDAATAVKAAYDDLVSKVQNSGPIKNIDAMYDQAAEKLKQATGGDQGVMTYVEKYRQFAKDHPVAQGLIYSALIAAAGISGAGLGGAAALGLLKMTDKLLQGEKFSTAVGKGIATGAMAFAASKLGDLIRGVKPGEQVPAPASDQAGSAQYGKMDFANNDYYLDPNSTQVVGVPKGYGSPFEEGTKAYDIRQQLAAGSQTTAMKENINLSKLEIISLFENIVIEAELWDKFKQGAGAAVTQVVGATPGEIAGAAKGAVSAVGQKLAQVGKNITTKVTADKLQSAWQAAGSPTDSEAIIDILKSQGITDDVITSIYTSANIARVNPKFAFITKLTPEQKQALLKQLDALAPQKSHTGGKVAGQVSQTPSAVRQRQARAAKSATPVAPTAPQQLPGDRTTSMSQLIKQRQAHGLSEGYQEFRKKLNKELNQ